MSIAEQIIDFSKIKATCSNCNLNELCLPRGLNIKDMEKLDHVVKGFRPIAKGEYIFRAGEEFEAFYAVRSGSVKVYVIDESDEEHIIGFYFPGEIIGFDEIKQHKHTCFAISLETTTFCSIPYNKSIEISSQIPEFQDQLLRLVSCQLSTENESLLTINKRNAEERMATFLINLSSRFHKLGHSAKEYNLAMSRALAF